MKKYIIKHRWLILLFSVFLSYCNSVFASHIVGMDLKYTHVSGNTYKIICVAYGDCGPASTTAFNTLHFAQPQINIYDGNSKVTCISLSIIPPEYGENIAKYVMCPGDTNSTTCTNPTNPYPGIKKFIYTGLYTVPYTSHYWRFIFNGYMGATTSAGRAAAITNISGNSTTQLEDTLDNTIYNNSNPTLSLEPILFFCINSHDTYNPVAVDADGDSLIFNLIPGIKGSASNCPSSDPGPYPTVSYLPGYTATNPLSDSPGTFNFNQNTGQINFVPNALQRSIVVYNIREFRDGHFVGSSQREMNFIVVTCTNNPPTVTTISNPVNGILGSDGLHFNTCQAPGLSSFTVDPHESNPANKIFVSVIGLPAGISMTLTGDSTNAPHVYFSFNSTSMTPGIYTIYLKLQDNNCPVNGENIIAITISIGTIDPIITGIDSICPGDTTTLHNTTVGGSWVSNNTSIASIGSSSGLAVGLNSGLVEIFYFDPTHTCKDSIQLVVKTPPAPIGGEDNICVDDVRYLSETTPGGYWYQSDSIITFFGGSSWIRGVSPGIDTIFYSVVGGCTVFKVISVNPIPTITGSDTGCTQIINILNVSPGGGIWSSSNTSIASVNTISPTTAGIFCATTGTVMITYTSPASCVYSFPYYVFPVVRDSIRISVSPDTIMCYGTLFNYTSFTVNGGTSPLLIWNVNGTNVATGSTFSYAPNNGDAVKCILISDTVCAYPKPDTSNVKTASIIKHTPNFVIGSLYGDTTCVGMANTYFISSATDTGTTPVIEWYVNHFPVDTGSTSYTFTPSYGDIITCKITVDLPCALPNPDIVSDSLVVEEYVIPSVTLSALGGNTVCQGNKVTIEPIPVWGGWGPDYYWSVNGIFADSGADFTYFPTNGDTVSCVMISNYPCIVPPDSALSNIGIVVDPVIIVNITAYPGSLIAVGQVDTLIATVENAGDDPQYQWYINGTIVPGATYPKFIYNEFVNKDSVTCIVTTGSGTPCKGIRGYNWIILAVAPVSANNINNNYAEYKLIPNPNEGSFELRQPYTINKELKAEIWNATGIKVFQDNIWLLNGSSKINLQNNAPGLYLLKITDQNGYSSILKFAIK